MRKNNKAISPVVSTVILAAITIPVAVAVSYWMGGIPGLYTRFEKVEISDAYGTYSPSGWNATTGGWVITVFMKNSGSADATIESVFLNGKPISENADVATVLSDLPLKLGSGRTGQVVVLIRKGEGSNFTEGTTIEIGVHSDYGFIGPNMISLD